MTVSEKDIRVLESLITTANADMWHAIPEILSPEDEATNANRPFIIAWAKRNMRHADCSMLTLAASIFEASDAELSYESIGGLVLTMRKCGEKHERASLMAACAIKKHQRYIQGENALSIIAEAIEIIERYLDHPILREIAFTHAYGTHQGAR